MPYYLAPYIGAGTDKDPFRPRGSDQPGWSAIDLRPDGGQTLAGAGLNACLLYLPASDPDPLLTLIGLDPADSLGPLATTALSAKVLGVDVPPGSVKAVIVHLMTSPPHKGWQAIRATHNGVYEIWLGGLLWATPVIRGGSSFSDDFNRADNTDLGSNWSFQVTDNHMELLSNAAVASAAGSTQCEEFSIAISPGPDQFAQIVLGTFTGSGLGEVEAHTRCAAVETRTFYLARAQKNQTNSTTLSKRVAGSRTELTNENATTWGGTDTCYLASSGTSHSVQRNGSLLLGPITDSAISSGSVGMGVLEATDRTQCTIDSFLGGDIAIFLPGTSVVTIAGLAPTRVVGTVLTPATP